MTYKGFQFVWWGKSWKGFDFWAFPRNYKETSALNNRPIFYGLVFGIFEIRFFPKRNENKI